eukprot:scaffold3826_cov407-Prasinococcus_capsulatus_cf.AAC.6
MVYIDGYVRRSGSWTRRSVASDGHLRGSRASRGSPRSGRPGPVRESRARLETEWGGRPRLPDGKRGEAARWLGRDACARVSSRLPRVRCPRGRRAGWTQWRKEPGSPPEGAALCGSAFPAWLRGPARRAPVNA